MEEILRMSPIQIGEMVKEWLEDDGYIIENAGLMNTDFGWSFTTLNHKIYVLKVKNRRDSIIVTGSFVLGKDKEKILKNPLTSELFYQLSMKYLELGLDYFFRPNFQSPDLIEICSPIHYDKLTKNQLAANINTIRNAVIWTKSKLDKELYGLVNSAKLDSVNSPLTEGLPY